ncbi:hypothetical protein RB653_004510 [Dictyostelium firmibasis]|uniref:Glutamine amidotransferase domain-containing protein n=1 Tax=Dictyostelium firmibasis TaxID=79012 RepID=A0AAN7YY96_9MYCE
MMNIKKSLRIGLLKCDSFVPDIKNKFGDIDTQFKNLLNSNTKSMDIDLSVFEVANDQFPSKEECLDRQKFQGFIISGSKSSVNDDKDWIKKLKEYIRFFSENNVKTIGVCFGHQAIATALGGKVSLNPKGWTVSDYRIDYINDSNFDKENPLVFNDIVKQQQKQQQQSSSSSSHLNIICINKEIVTDIPKDFKIFAKNERSDNQAMYFKNQFYSFQGHPEYTPELIKATILSRRGIIPDDVIEDGVNRANNSNIDKSTFANGMIDFFVEK